MKAIILCGGRGTRIRNASEVLPKPMLPIGGRPILWHIMKIYSQYGVNEFVICLGYKGWKIKEFFLYYKSMLSDFTVTLGEHDSIEFHNEPEEMKWKVTLLETGENALTGARIYKAKEHVKEDENFCVTYGDGVADVDIRSLIEFHKKNKIAGTITGVRPLGRFGEIELEGNIVTEFNEKPNVSSGRINGGFMVFNNDKVWDYFREGDDLILEMETLSNMSKDRELGVFEHNGYWQCMDTVREYDILNKLHDDGNAPWETWKNK
jgi:glucose-1-phosphate cytidylyltransferase